MNHETLQALYALDVTEVGEEEAAKRWEYQFSNGWFTLTGTPIFTKTSTYRRKPDLPWSKVMMQDIDVNPETMFKLIKTVKYLVGIAERACGRLIKDEETPEKFVLDCVKSLETKQEWPADAPEWANAAIVSYFTDAVGLTKKASQSLIERPKPVVKKIDWSKVSNSIKHSFSRPDKIPSPWIAWNCDEHTKGNPLPDGLVVEWYHITGLIMPLESTCYWDKVRAFRIIGIQEGWE